MSDPARELMVRCNCHSHIGYLYAEVDDAGKPSIYFIIASMYPDTRLTGELRERIKTLWHIARGRRHWFEELVLIEPEARQLRDFLSANLSKGEK